MKNNIAKKSVFLVTLGCKVNQSESEALAQLFSDNGYDVVTAAENPDVIVVNTCTVTGTGSSKSRKVIRRMANEHPQSVLVVMGCYSQLNPEDVAELEGVDLVLGTQDRMTVLDHLDRIFANVVNTDLETKNILRVVSEYDSLPEYEELPLVKQGRRVRAMVKIQDGCSQFCSYCIVPLARGPSRSRAPEKILQEVQELILAGYKEIVLTGIHIGVYGADFNTEQKVNTEEIYDLSSLIDSIAQIPGLVRLRLGSIEPREISRELLDVIAKNEKTVCLHFHIPLQSGSNTVLQRMNRPYTTGEYLSLLSDIRKRFPEAAISADVMTGFPGETREEHAENMDFIKKCQFASVHVFPYSRRPGTVAADMPGQIEKKEKNIRVKDIIGLGMISRGEYVESFINREVQVLLEKIDSRGNAQGYTENYIETKIPSKTNFCLWKIGDIIKIKLEKDMIID